MRLTEEYSLLEKWREKLINAFWGVACILFITEVLVGYYLVMIRAGDVVWDGGYFVYYIAMPSSINFAATAVTYWLNKSRADDRVKNLATAYCLLIMCFVTATFHGYFQMTSCIFVMPIIVSVMFESRKTLRIVAVSSLAFMVLSLFTANRFDHTWSLLDRVTHGGIVSFAFMTGSYLLCEVLIRYLQEKTCILKSNAQKIASMSRALKMDAMTGLYNHSEFYQQLEVARKSGDAFHVAMLDVDYFKKFNDIYGHDNGDIVLIEIANILREKCEGIGSAFRYGGEEFALIFHLAEGQDAYIKMEEIRCAVNGIALDFAPSEKIGISCGVYKYHGGATCAEDIFVKADQALYEAKRGGRNRCVVYDESQLARCK